MKNPIHRALAALSICLGAVTIAVAVPGIASAHTPNQAVACAGWSVTLTNYEGGTNNNDIVITVDGTPTTYAFGGSLSKSGTWDQYADHAFQYVINANKVSGNATQYDHSYGPVTQTHCKTNPLKPEDKVSYTDWVGGTPACGEGTVVQTRTKSVTTYTLNADHQWVAGTPVVTTETRTVEVQVTPCPTTPPTTVPPTTQPPTTEPPTTVPPVTPPTTPPAPVVPPAPPAPPAPPVAPPAPAAPVVLPQTGASDRAAGAGLIGIFALALGGLSMLVARRRPA